MAVAAVAAIPAIAAITVAVTITTSATAGEGETRRSSVERGIKKDRTESAREGR